MLVLIHGFLDTPRTWELVLPALEREHEVLTPTLPGHAGGPPVPDEITTATMADAIERVLDEAGVETAHLAGNSVGGYVALQLAARGRARSVVAFAPAGGWARGDTAYRGLLRFQTRLHELAKAAAPHAGALLSTPEGRRRATEYIVVNYEHIPPDVIAHQMLGVAGATGARALAEFAAEAEWTLDAERIECPVRVVWGTEDRLLPWPSAAERYRHDWLPHADWVVLDDVGHCPQLDVPAVAAELILGFAS